MAIIASYVFLGCGVGILAAAALLAIKEGALPMSGGAGTAIGKRASLNLADSKGLNSGKVGVGIQNTGYSTINESSKSEKFTKKNNKIAKKTYKKSLFVKSSTEKLGKVTGIQPVKSVLLKKKKSLKSPLQLFLKSKPKRRLNSGEKLYRQRMKMLKNYMQINLERGVEYPALHKKLISIGWKKEDIKKVYRKIS